MRILAFIAAMMAGVSLSLLIAWMISPPSGVGAGMAAIFFLGFYDLFKRLLTSDNPNIPN